MLLGAKQHFHLSFNRFLSMSMQNLLWHLYHLLYYLLYSYFMCTTCVFAVADPPPAPLSIDLVTHLVLSQNVLPQFGVFEEVVLSFLLYLGK